MNDRERYYREKGGVEIWVIVFIIGIIWSLVLQAYTSTIIFLLALTWNICLLMYVNKKIKESV
jgi:hypothetical protein